MDCLYCLSYHFIQRTSLHLSRASENFRSIPKPNLPPTSNAKLSANYYYTRDERRKAGPPLVTYSTYSAPAPRIESGER